LNIPRKGAGIVFTATLLATLVATVAAPFAAAVTPVVTSAGSVPKGGTSTGTASFQFTEKAAACFVAASPALTVTILDSASGNTVNFVGTPTITGAPGSLGATASASGNVLTINFAGADNAQVESLTVGGLKISASTGAAAGAIKAALGGNATDIACVFSGTTTATGTLQSILPNTALGALVNTTSACGFQITNGQAGSTDADAGKATFSDVADSRNIVAPAPAPPTAPGLQVVNFDVGANTHGIGIAVTQTVGLCAAGQTLGSPGTVTVSLNQTATSHRQRRGEQSARRDDDPEHAQLKQRVHWRRR